ncbi:MAG: hypothetical protein KJ888_20610 [Gammaproteobacteria bacterium]|uniref:Uncharacterized protein n=1 Tax=viral metagenome TaxID=1070528 RepID=A0A6H1ZXL5_9ZZZZ|nr:hypothetical protein [Gammaproteobacteria bacterium]
MNKEMKDLLIEARDVLGEYKFTEDGEYNNSEVIILCDKIDEFLKQEGG